VQFNVSKIQFDNTPYFQAHTFQDGERGCLWVYKSVAVRESDLLFKPVKDFLTTSASELLISGSVEDETMMFGEAEWSVYVIGGLEDAPQCVTAKAV
jgi:hypothetical protein